MRLIHFAWYPSPAQCFYHGRVWTGSGSGIFNTNTPENVFMINLRVASKRNINCSQTNPYMRVYACRFPSNVTISNQRHNMQMYWSKLSYFPHSVDFPHKYGFDRISHRRTVKSHKRLFPTSGYLFPFSFVFLINDADTILIFNRNFQYRITCAIVKRFCLFLAIIPTGLKWNNFNSYLLNGKLFV